MPEAPAILPRWLNLVEKHAVSGRQVHDTRIVAVMQAHGVTHLLTLNPKDFQRYPGVTVIEPKNL